MIELFDAIVKYWPVGAIIFHMGALTWMVHTNNKAMARLFKNLETLNSFMAAQHVENSNVNLRITEHMTSDERTLDEILKGQSSLTQRTDRIFELLQSRG